ncbi:MAG: response regulator, partial [Proteobacteria bacterium]|nr:response regulator [Pseudomonadota bacterium]
KVTTTNNPFEVVQFVKEREYDLIISDLKMPGMGGIELIAEIRKTDQYIPILVITAYGSIESAEEAINKGAYDYITKPFRKEQILIAIDRALEWKNMRKELSDLKEEKKR